MRRPIVILWVQLDRDLGASRRFQRGFGRGEGSLFGNARPASSATAVNGKRAVSMGPDLGTHCGPRDSAAGGATLAATSVESRAGDVGGDEAAGYLAQGI